MMVRNVLRVYMTEIKNNCRRFNKESKIVEWRRREYKKKSVRMKREEFYRVIT